MNTIMKGIIFFWGVAIVGSLLANRSFNLLTTQQQIGIGLEMVGLALGALLFGLLLRQYKSKDEKDDNEIIPNEGMSNLSGEQK